MLTVYDSKNQQYILTAKIGSGGEGTVFYSPNDAQTVAKIYHEPITDEKAEKLRSMAVNKNERLSKVAVWITDILTDIPGGKVIGFLMPHVKAKEIHELYSLKSRRVHFPEATWKFLIHAATNVARAFYNLHRAGHVMGDVNHGNCVVLADGTVKLIDCDSYAIKNGAHRYRCEVGVATHLAPELQGKNLRDVTREFRHDNFGLAVIIFQLLFLGRHPFAGNYAGGEDKSLEDCIREQRFAYGGDAHLWKIKQPPGTLSLSAVSPRLAFMFERAFLTENRPEPREWIEALEDLSNTLKQCALHPGHYFFAELTACPWCEIETNTGLMLFPFSTGGDGESFNIFTVESLVASINVPHNLPAKLPANAVLPPPSAEVQIGRRYNRNVLAIVALAQFIFLSFLLITFGAFAAFFISIPAMCCALLFVIHSNKIYKDEFRDNLENAGREWKNLNEEWQQSETSRRFRENFERIRNKISDYQNIHRASREKIQRAQEEKRRRDLEKYLSGFRLVYSEIPGIGEKRREVLREFGVKTAMDVEPQRLVSIPGVSSATAEKLVDWRENLEKNFAFQPFVLSADEQKSLAVEVSSARKNIEREIENLLGALRSGSLLVRRQQQKLLAESEILAARILQCESNLKAVGNNVAAIGVLACTTLFTLAFGSALTDSSPASQSRTDASGATYSGLSVPPPPMPKQNNAFYNREDYAVYGNLTDDQISAMTASQREKAAENLYLQTVPGDSYFVNDYNVKEQKMRLAVRLSPKPEMLNQLAFILYEKEKYTDSIEILNRSLAIDAENLGTKTFLGMNYLKTKKYDKARRIFNELIGEYPTLSGNHFNLGLAYQGLGDYKSALASLRKADEITPNDADTQYEIVRCLVAVGDRDAALRERQKLGNLDTTKAQELLRLLYSSPTRQ
jgi:DNA-binding helix-hairpin-helix protein with protein kinase domain